MTPKAKCLVPSCKKDSIFRGLCLSHYTYAAFLVRNGKTTWDELVENGKALPRHHRTSSHWLVEFNKKGKK